MTIIFLLLTICIGYTQDTIGHKVSPTFVLAKDILANPVYLKQVWDKAAPNAASTLEKKVASYQIEASPVFDGKESYRITFSQNKAKITAVFDPKGTIAWASESYREVPVPQVVMKTITKNYPKWSVAKNEYCVHYNKCQKVDKRFKLKLLKGNRKKHIELNMDGNLIK